MNELGIDVLRCSFGWDDFEPFPGDYDFAWLKDFVTLAAAYSIKLRPRIGYTPRWTGTAGSADGADWNNPPADYGVWYRFVYHLVRELRGYSNVLVRDLQRAKRSGLVGRISGTIQGDIASRRACDPRGQPQRAGVARGLGLSRSRIAASGY